MKSIGKILLVMLILSPVFVLGRETVQTDRIQASIEDSGNWELTDTFAGITWQGKWIAPMLMKVSGSDGSCFVIGENENGFVQLDCRDLRQISILLAYS